MQPPNYDTSPWRPEWNNMDADGCSDGSDLPRLPTADPFPEFYQICNTNESPCPSTATNNQLNCLGKIQKNFVDNIVDVVKNDNPHPVRGPHFKNVFFEIMNEAPLSTDTAAYERWHNTVAKWIELKGAEYLVAASVEPSNDNAWNSCLTTTCTNAFRVFKLGRIDIVNLHSLTWVTVSSSVAKSFHHCQTAKDARDKFGKSVIIGDDGGEAAPERNVATTVRQWAIDTTLGGCSNIRGQFHFDHLDGLRMETKTKAGCTTTNEDCLDCTLLDKIGEVPPICSRPGGCAEGTYSSTYCGNPFPGTTSTLSASAMASPASVPASPGSMVPVMVLLDVLDLEDPNPSIRLVAVEATESGQIGNVLEPGDVEGAEFGTDDRTLFLRAEKRYGPKREYIITYEITDARGNLMFAEATVNIE